MILEPDELIALTKRSRRDAQVRVLCYMGIEHKIRPDGTIAVLRSHVEKLMGGSVPTQKVKKEVEPDWSAI